MLFLFAFLIFLVILGSNFFMGSWNLFLNLVITILAATFATSFFEVVAEILDGAQPSYTYFADFLGLWLLFFLSFIVLRLFAEMLSSHKLRLSPFVDYPLRVVLGTALAWVFICFTFFTFHTAPVPNNWLGFQRSPDTWNLLVGPDRMWLQYAQSRSRGALAEFRNAPWLDEDERAEHPDDEGRNCRVFDPFSEFIFKYRQRRVLLNQEKTLRVE